MDVVSGCYVLEVVCYVQQLTDTVSKPLTHAPVLLVCSSGNTSSSPFLRTAEFRESLAPPVPLSLPSGKVGGQHEPLQRKL